MIPKLKILFAVLDWGIGHATRSKPVIEYLISKNCEVVIAGSGNSAQYLQRVFPDLEFLDLPDYKIHYSKRNNQIPILFRQLIKNYFVYLKENKLVNKFVKNSDIDIIISDNRFGVYSNKCRSYYISHQLQFRFKGFFKVFQNPVAYFHTLIINKFDAVLIPDNIDNSIAGIISKSNKTNQNNFYIGPLSRFCCDKINENIISGNDNYILFLLSGPEPQRCILENLLIKASKKFDKKIVMVRGLPSNKGYENREYLEIIDFADENELQNLILNADFVVCRSGYSTIMDLWTLKRKALLIPTPGQPEQEYLAKYLNEQYSFKYIEQSDIEHFNWNALTCSFVWEHNGKTEDFRKNIDQLILNNLN